MSRGLELATILRKLPEDYQDQGPIGAIRSAYRYGYENPLWRRSEAVRIAFLANMERAESWGGGHRAARRIKLLSATTNLQKT